MTTYYTGWSKMAENKQTLHPSRMCISNNNKNIRNLYAKAEKRAAFFFQTSFIQAQFLFFWPHTIGVFFCHFVKIIEGEIGIHTISEWSFFVCLKKWEMISNTKNIILWYFWFSFSFIHLKKILISKNKTKLFTFFINEYDIILQKTKTKNS